MKKIILSIWLALFGLPALADVNLVGSSTNINSGGSCTAGAGSNRVVVIALGAEPTATSSDLVVSALTYGTNSLANSQIIQAVTGVRTGSVARTRAAIYYIKEANILSGAQTVTVTYDQAISGTAKLTCFTLSGVDQTTPVENTLSNGNTTSSDPWTGSVTLANNSFAILQAVANSQVDPSAPDAAWTEDRDVYDGGATIAVQHKDQTTGGSTTWTVDWGGASGGSLVIASFGEVSVSAPTLSSVTLGTATATTQPINYTNSDSVSTVHAVACKKDSTAPTVANVLADKCTGASTPEASASEATTGSADSITLTGLGPIPVYDFYVASTNAGGNSSLSTLADGCLAAPSGKQIINCPNGLTSITSGGAIDSLNAVITPDLAVGDIPIVDSATTPEGCAVTMSLGGVISIAGPGGTGSCSSARQYVNATFYDVSASAMHADDLDWWMNNVAPDCSPAAFLGPYKINSDSFSYDYTVACVDAEGDALTCAKSSGTYSPGLSLASCVLSGTPTTENESGDASTTTVTDITGATGTQDITVYPINTITAPDCTTSHLNLGTCIDTLTNVLLSANTVTLVCNPSVDAGNVISQSPVAGAQVDTPWTVDLTVSRGTCRALRNRIGIEHSISLH